MFCRPVKIHRKARPDNQVTSDRTDPKLVQLAAQHDGVFVMKRGIAPRDYQVSGQRPSRFVDLAANPQRSLKTMLGSEVLQSHERSRQLDC